MQKAVNDIFSMASS